MTVAPKYPRPGLTPADRKALQTILGFYAEGEAKQSFDRAKALRFGYAALMRIVDTSDFASPREDRGNLRVALLGAITTLERGGR